MYETGTQINHTSEETVDVGFKFEKNEVCIMRSGSYSIGGLWNETTINNVPSEQALAVNFIESIKKLGGRVAYLKAEKRIVTIVGRDTDHYTVFFDIIECHFIADPVIIPVIVLVILIIAGTSVAILWIMRPAVFKALGVTPSDLLAYNLADLPWLIPVVVLVAIYFMYVASKGRRKK